MGKSTNALCPPLLSSEDGRLSRGLPKKLHLSRCQKQAEDLKSLPHWPSSTSKKAVKLFALRDSAEATHSSSRTLVARKPNESPCTLSDAISQALFSSNFDETIFARQVGSQICWLVAMPKSSKALLQCSEAGQSAGRHLRSVGMRVTWSIPGAHVGWKKIAGVSCCWQQSGIASYESGRSRELSQHPSSTQKLTKSPLSV